MGDVTRSSRRNKHPDEKTEAERISERLIADLDCAFAAQEYLPGFDQLLAKRTEAADWIDKQCASIDQAVRDVDAALFEKALGSWIKANDRVNEILAEEYRQTHPDPETWELRYLKWMTHVKWIKFGSPLGEFYLVPRAPRSRPKAQYWYTVDEMLAMVEPGVALAIKTFDQLPIRPESLPRPGAGENHMNLKPGDPDRPIWFRTKSGGP